MSSDGSAAERVGAPSATPPPVRVVVEEPRLPRRVRRPGDLLQTVLGLALVVAVVVAGHVTVGTATGLEQDLVGVSRGAPKILIELVNLVANTGLLLLPVVAAADLVLRRRVGQVFDALVGAAACAAITVSLAAWVVDQEPVRILETLTKVLPNDTRSSPLLHVMAAVVAFLVVADSAARKRLRVAYGLTLLAVLVSSVLSGDVTLLTVVVSVLIGWTVGSATRYALGRVSTRPDGSELADAINRAGVVVTAIRRVGDDRIFARSYVATDDDGNAYDVTVLDRDREGAGYGKRLWRQLRVVGPAARTTPMSMRGVLEHDALASYAARAAGVSTPSLVLAHEVSDDAALLVHERRDGRLLADLPEEAITDKVLADLWEQHRRLLQARIAHHALTPARVLVHDDERVSLLDLRYAVVAANELQLRLDTAELLVTLALLVGPRRAVRSGIDGIGAEDVADALPLLQPIALTATTRSAVRRSKGLLRELRTAVIDSTPSPPTEPAQLERLSLRTVISAAGVTVGAYVLLGQLGQVDLASLLSSAEVTWALAAGALSVTTYVGATLSFIGFVPRPLSFVRTFVAQIATSFVNLLAPSSLGGAALNARYLERSGVEPALAVASVGVAQVAALTIHLLMLLIFGILTGTADDTPFSPPAEAVVVIVVLLVVAAVFLMVPAGRGVLQSRIRPMLGRVLPQLVAVFQQPSKLLTGLSGNLMLNLSYSFCLVACVRAFGGDISIPAIAIVYLAGSAVGTAVPTPGGLGAVEAALAAGLSAAGLDTATAISSVLLFRLVTFWIPVPLGWLAFLHLQRKQLL